MIYAQENSPAGNVLALFKFIFHLDV